MKNRIIESRYRIVRLLSSGAGFKSFLALDELLQREVELILFMPENPDTEANTQIIGQAGKELFRSRADQMLHLEKIRGFHPLYDRIRDEGLIGVTAEYTPGITLQERLLRQRHPDRKEAEEVFLQLIRLFSALHEKDFFYGCLRPDQIYLGEDCTLAVSPAGAFEWLFLPEKNGLRILDGKDRVNLLPPEFFTSSFEIGPWSDVYQIAAIYVWMETGNFPQGAIHRMMRDENRILSGKLSGGIPESVVLRALSLDRKERFPSAAACGDMLQSVREEKKELNSGVKNPDRKRLFFMAAGLAFLGAALSVLFPLLHVSVSVKDPWKTGKTTSAGLVWETETGPEPEIMWEPPAETEPEIMWEPPAETEPETQGNPETTAESENDVGPRSEKEHREETEKESQTEFRPKSVRKTEGVRFAVTRLNIRDLPDTEKGTVTGMLEAGDRIEIDEILDMADQSWYHMQSEKGTGYVAVQYTSETEPQVETEAQHSAGSPAVQSRTPDSGGGKKSNQKRKSKTGGSVIWESGGVIWD